MNCFLDKNDVVEDFSSFDGSALIFRDYPGQHSFNPGDYNFGYQLVPSIAQRDRPEAIES